MRWPSDPPPVVYAVPGERTSPKFAAAFAQGCRGYVVPITAGLQPGPFAAFCTPPTWPLLDQARADHRTFYYGDHAFFRRGKYYRVTRDAFQVQPTAADLALATPDRFRACGANLIEDWQRTSRSSIIICPNSPTYMARFGIDAKQWTLDVARVVSQYSDRPIVIRWKQQASVRPLYADLHDAHIVIVYNSASAVEALLHGVPIVTLCPWATTVSMGLTDLAQIESPVYPDTRHRFLWALAEQQWTLQEMQTGLAWRALCAKAERDQHARYTGEGI